MFGISTDSPFTPDAWAKGQRLQFALLGDYNEEVSRAYGCLYDEFLELKGVVKRAAYVVDRQDRIGYAQACSDPRDLPDFEAIKRCPGDLP